MGKLTDVNVNNALPCPMPASFRLRNITAVLAIVVVLISPSRIALTGITAVVVVTVYPSSLGIYCFDHHSHSFIITIFF